MLSGTRPIGVGIIGLSAEGGWAALAHVPALRAMPDRFAITGLCASTSERAAAAARAHSVPFSTDDPTALARRPDVDLIAVTVKVPHHRELVAHALAAGKAIYCEWPLGRACDEATAMASAAADCGSPAFVGLQARSAPALRYLRDLIAQGHVGEVLSTSVVGAGGFPWVGVASTGTAYALDQTTGATMLSIPFGHMIDAFTWTLGGFEQLNATLATKYPAVRLLDAEVEAVASGPDQIAVSGMLQNGAVAALHYRGGDSPAAGFRWEITGTEGTLLAEGETGHLQYGHIRLRGRRGDAPLEDLPVPAGYHCVGTDPTSYAHALAHAYRAVHDDLTTGTSSAPTFADAVETHRLLNRIEQASGWNHERA